MSACLLAAGLLAAGHARAASTDMGSLLVDVREAPRGIMKAHLRMPVTPGALTLVYPKWLPGRHSPAGPATSLAAPRFSVHGEPLAWARDPVDMYAFHLDIPAGASELECDLEFSRYPPPTAWCREPRRRAPPRTRC